MAQLIKLQDYISRYEVDMFKYPSQFIRLKKEHYDKIFDEWQKELEHASFEEGDIILSLPTNELELKQKFLNNIFPFQLKWASSTISEVSFLDKAYEADERLKYYLQRFPDTYLLMYEPIFKLKQAVIDGEVIIITPFEIMCITELNAEESTHFQPIDDRKWIKKQRGKETTIVSPIIGLNRMTKTIQSILNYHNIEFPIKKVVLAKDHMISDVYEPYNTEIIDQLKYEKWFNQLRQTSHSLKFRQLKASEALLNHTQKTFIKRPEWHDDDVDMTIE